MPPLKAPVDRLTELHEREHALFVAAFPSRRTEPKARERQRRVELLAAHQSGDRRVPCDPFFGSWPRMTASLIGLLREHRYDFGEAHAGGAWVGMVPNSPRISAGRVRFRVERCRCGLGPAPAIHREDAPLGFRLRLGCFRFSREGTAADRDRNAASSAKGARNVRRRKHRNNQPRHTGLQIEHWQHSS